MCVCVCVCVCVYVYIYFFFFCCHISTWFSGTRLAEARRCTIILILIIFKMKRFWHMTYIFPGRLLALWNKNNIFIFFILSCCIFVSLLPFPDYYWWHMDYGNACYFKPLEIILLYYFTFITRNRGLLRLHQIMEVIPFQIMEIYHNLDLKETQIKP